MNVKHKMEILAPAGSPECLEPAVRCGADAVYLGASRFSARSSAANFDRAALADAVQYCHARGVRVYLALNTLLHDDELPDALALAEYACTLPVDELIVQDLGLIRLLRACAPKLKLSASTQMSIHSPAGAALCASLGMGRVVLSRELSGCEIRAIADAADVELEAFVHGALCMSVSGQCYFSAMLGGRSGNRGRCAQPCRLPFAAPGGTGHDLSLKDLSLIDQLDAMADAGVCSAKIEGRMKRPEYVAAAVTACRCARDGEPEPEGLHGALRSVFSRSGFTSGYFDGARGRAMFGIRQKEDVEAASPAVLGQLHTLYRAERPRIAVTMQFTAHAGAPCVLSICDGPRAVFVTADPPQPARTRPLTSADAARSLGKLGGTPFFVENEADDIACSIDDGVMLPASALNALRRAAVDALLRARAAHTPVDFDASAAPERLPERPRPAQAALRLHFGDPAQLPHAVPPQTELIYLPLDAPEAAVAQAQALCPRVGFTLPRGTFGTEPAVVGALRRARERDIADVWCGTLNTLAMARASGMTIHGGFSLNAANSRAVEQLALLGAADLELSPELTLAQMAQLRRTLPLGALIWGRLPLMLTRCCPIRNGTDCAHCTKRGALTDRKGAQFPVRCGGGCSEVLNSVPLCWLDRQRELPALSFVSMRFHVENRVEIEETLAHFSAQTRPLSPITRGLYEKGVF